MAKVYPHLPMSSSSSNRETFTIWMKSLVLNGNGCTVFSSNGEIVFRIDNYDRKRSNEVYLMDLHGNVLCTILRKKPWFFSRWDGYKCNGSKVKKENLWFQVRKHCKILKRSSAYKATIGCDRAQASCYTIQGSAGKLAFKILDIEQRLVAEVKRKQSSSGVVFGADVLSMVVEPYVDHYLIMALITVCGLIGHKM